MVKCPRCHAENREYNRYRPHSSLGYKPPAPEAYEAKNLIMKVVH